MIIFFLLFNKPPLAKESILTSHYKSTLNHLTHSIRKRLKVTAAFYWNQDHHYNLNYE